MSLSSSPIVIPATRRSGRRIFRSGGVSSPQRGEAIENTNPLVLIPVFGVIDIEGARRQPDRVFVGVRSGIKTIRRGGTGLRSTKEISLPNRTTFVELISISKHDSVTDESDDDGTTGLNLRFLQSGVYRIEVYYAVEDETSIRGFIEDGDIESLQDTNREQKVAFEFGRGETMLLVGPELKMPEGAYVNGPEFVNVAAGTLCKMIIEREEEAPIKIVIKYEG